MFTGFPVRGEPDVHYPIGMNQLNMNASCCRIDFEIQFVEQLELFASSEAGADGSEESKINENFLRTNVRQLFLDPCPSGRHKATWLGAIADYVGTKPFARLIILLYGPTNLQGKKDATLQCRYRIFSDHFSFDQVIWIGISRWKRDRPVATQMFTSRWRKRWRCCHSYPTGRDRTPPESSSTCQVTSADSFIRFDMCSLLTDWR